MRKLRGMSTRHRIRLGLPVLFLALVFPTACKGVPQPPQVTTAGVRIDVESARGRRNAIVVEIRIWNDFDEAVTFEHSDARLLYQGREVSAKPYRSWRGGKPKIQAKSNLDFRWAFELGEGAAGGQNYKIEIRDMMRGEVPLGDTAVFEIAL
jgi:hypothetical protein